MNISKKTGRPSNEMRSSGINPPDSGAFKPKPVISNGIASRIKAIYAVDGSQPTDPQPTSRWHDLHTDKTYQHTRATRPIRQL